MLINKINVLFIILFIFFFLFIIDANSLNQRAYITACSGLNLRDKPSIQAKRLFLIPYMSRVEIIKYSEKPEKIGSKISKWAYIRYINKEGWVFAGYLLNEDKIMCAYVDKIQGIDLFTQPDSPHKNIVHVPYKEKLIILKRTNITQKNNTFVRYWRYKWKDMEGWWYDSGISFVKIPDYGITQNIEDTEEFNKRIHRYYDAIIRKYGNSRKEVVSSLGAPIKKYIKKVENRHNPSKSDYIHTFFYKNLEIVIYETYFKKEFVLNLQVTSQKYNIGKGFLNKNIQNVFNYFGIPHDDRCSFINYNADESAGTGMSFYIKNRIVKRIVFYSYPN